VLLLLELGTTNSDDEDGELLAALATTDSLAAFGIGMGAAVKCAPLVPALPDLRRARSWRAWFSATRCLYSANSKPISPIVRLSTVRFTNWYCGTPASPVLPNGIVKAVVCVGEPAPPDDGGGEDDDEILPVGMMAVSIPNKPYSLVSHKHRNHMAGIKQRT